MRVLELFSGCGGAALGLQRAGFSHLACAELDEAAAATLRAARFPALQVDIQEASWAGYAGFVDLLWASPPCQAGSTAGRRQGALDARNGWPWTFRVVDEVRPRWVLAENVLGWTYHREGCDRRGRDLSCVGCYWHNRVLPDFRARFAHVGIWRCNAADYGVPQQRRRVILWAGPDRLPEEPPAPTHLDPGDGALPDGIQPWVSLRVALGDSFRRESCRGEGGDRACYGCSDHGRACSEPWRLERPAPTVTTKEVKGTRAHAPD